MLNNASGSLSWLFCTIVLALRMFLAREGRLLCVSPNDSLPCLPWMIVLLNKDSLIHNSIIHCICLHFSSLAASTLHLFGMAIPILGHLVTPHLRSFTRSTTYIVSMMISILNR